MLPLPRVQAFEFNDLTWLPSSLRESIVEALSRALRWGRMLRGMVPVFSEFMAGAGVVEVLDLCAGAAGPACILVDEIARAGGVVPRLLLTDLHPHVDAWRHAEAAHPGVLSFLAEPLDATRIPPAVSRGRARVIINAFHHFPPSLAAAILADAVRSGAPVFISEGFQRNPLQFLNFAPAGLAALLVNPVLSPRSRAQKMLLTWLSPIALAASVWDGMVSTLRVYNEAELRAMVAPLGDGYEWVYRTYRYPPRGTGYCFYGLPRRAG